MNSVTVTVESKPLNELAANIEAAKKRALERLAKRGVELLQDEIPKKSGNLKKGIGKPKFDFQQSTATIAVSAISEAKPRQASVYGSKSTAARQITLRGSQKFDYAAGVKTGRTAQIAPKGRAFLIPVSSVSSGEGYIDDGKQKYVVRTKISAVAPNPFDERAANRLSSESESIASSAIKEFFK